MTQHKTKETALRKEVLSIGKHSLIYVVGPAITRAVGFFMIPVYTRFITPTNYGAMEIIEILSAILLLTISAGASDSLSRFYYNETDTDRRNEVVSTTIIGFAVISIPLVAVFWFSSNVLSNIVLVDDKYSYILKIAFITTWFGMLCDVGYAYLRMVYKSKLFVAMTTLQLILALSLNIFFVVFLRLDILGIFYSTMISQAIIGFIHVNQILRQVGTRVSKPLLIEICKYGMPLVPSRIGLNLGFASNRFFLRWLGYADPAVALAQIGLFSLGHKFGVVVYQFVSAPLNSFWAPRRMELLFDGNQEAATTIARVCTYATFCSIYAGLLLTATIASLIEIMADPRYHGAHTVVPFVVLSYIAMGLESHFITGILYSKQTKLTTYITLLSIVVIVVWNIIFIPRYGLLGAASSMLAGFIPRLLLVYFCSQRLFPIPFEVRRLATMLAVAIVLYFFSQMVSLHSPYATLAVRGAITATFPLFLFIIDFFHQGERQFILDCFRKGVSAIFVNK